MREIKAYECPFCLKVFRSKRHNCKFNSEFKNCFTCKNNIGFNEGVYYDDYDRAYGQMVSPSCEKNDTDLVEMSRVGWRLNCTSWEMIDSYKNKKSYVEHIYKCEQIKDTHSPAKG